MSKAVFFLGSEKDQDHADKIRKPLEEWGIETVTHVTSAHKVPEKLMGHLEGYNSEENLVFVTIAGRSNGISGVTAGSTHHPVIACPPFSDKADYLTNIHSTLQMPSNTPYATVVDPVNAAQLALRILAICDDGLRAKAKAIVEETKSQY